MDNIVPQNNEEQKTEAVETPAQPAKKKWGMLIFKIFIWLLALAIVAVVVVGAGIYKLGWKGAYIDKAEAVFPYPIAVVDWRIVTLNDFNERFAAFKQAVKANQDFNFDDPKNKDTVKQQKTDIINRMVELKLEDKLAGSRNIKVTSSDITQEIAGLAMQAKIPVEEMDSTIKKLYGWTRQQFIDEILIPQIEERKLQIAVNADKQIDSDAFKKAQEVEDKLAAGGDFAQLAKEYSTDPGSKDKGGDLGWTAQGSLVPEFETAALALEPGKISQPIATQYGLHIIQLIEKSEKDGKTQFHTRHILVSPVDFPQWLKDQKAKAKIWTFQVE